MQYDTWSFFKMSEITIEEARKHYPEILTEEGDVNKDMVIDILFTELKKIRRIAKTNAYKLE